MGDPEPEHKVVVNPYTVALANCFSNWKGTQKQMSQDIPTVQFLTNMIQGRLLQHMVERIAEYYQIDDPTFTEELAALIVEIFANELFACFRSQVESHPELIVQIAKKIIDTEIPSTHQSKQDLQRLNRLFVAITRKYLCIDNLESVTETLQSEPRIQKLVMSAVVKKNLNDMMNPMAQYVIDHDNKDFLTHAFIKFGRNYYPFLVKVNKINNKIKSRFGLDALKALNRI